MPDSDSEEDFMSDKFLLAAAASSSSTAPRSTYADRRKEAARRAQQKPQQAQAKPIRQREEEARRKGLSTSLFAGVGGAAGSDDVGGEVAAPPVGGKAMGMMMKMGWKVGEGLGKQNQINEPERVARIEDPLPGGTKPDDEDLGEGSSKGGIGLASRKRPRSSSPPSAQTRPPPHSKPRLEPIRISMWSGKHGLGLRPRSPSPKPESTLDPTSSGGMDFLDGVQSGGKDGGLTKESELAMNKSADVFRKRRAMEGEERRIEGREWAARKVLMEMDEAKGVKFHPLHIMPSHPAQTIPKPLLRIMYPHLLSPSRARGSNIAYDSAEDKSSSENDDVRPRRTAGRTLRPDPAIGKNRSAAQALRAQMRRDAIRRADGSTDEDERAELEDPSDVFGQENRDRAQADVNENDGGDDLRTGARDSEQDKDMEIAQVDWPSMIKGVEKVMSMSPKTHLDFLVSSLREDHLYCFWCSASYESYDQMDGPRGCPGEEEDDH